MSLPSPTTSSISLHEAILAGNEQGVYNALEAGANVNECDPVGRSALCCALLGEDVHTIAALPPELKQSRLAILKLLLGRQDLSLFTLNHPIEFAHGVTPLGLACWSSKTSEAVALLQSGLVAVDGMDFHGATPLMYAARDGNIEIVTRLLDHTARPDLLDANHRSAIQYALRHPQVVWLCESYLRRQRTKIPQRVTPLAQPNTDSLLRFLVSATLQTTEHMSLPPESQLSSQSLLFSTESIIHAIETNNIELLHALLFPSPVPISESIFVSKQHVSTPPIINHLDPHGFAPIHRVMMVPHPSMPCVDALFRAGADMALLSSGNRTPLHILARFARDSPSIHPSSSPLYSFTVHLVQDLKAPLAALDDLLETCIHIAAEYGESPQVLAALLHCDFKGVVRDLKNDRGLRAIEVAKSDFLHLFHDNLDRPMTSASTHTVMPKPSKASLSTIASKTSVASIITVGHHLFDIEPVFLPNPSINRTHIQQCSQEIFRNLERCSVALQNDPERAPLAELSLLLNGTRQLSNIVLGYWKAKMNDSYRSFKTTNKDFAQTEKLLSRVSHLVKENNMQRTNDQLRVMTQVSGRILPRRGSVPLPPAPHLNPRKVVSEPSSPSSWSRASSIATHPTTDIDANLESEIYSMLERHHISRPDAINDMHQREVIETDWLEKFVVHNESTAYQIKRANLEELHHYITQSMEKLEILDSKVNDLMFHGSVNPRTIRTLRTLMSNRREEDRKLAELRDEKNFLEWCIKGLKTIGREMDSSAHLTRWLKQNMERPQGLRLDMDCLWDEDGGVETDILGFPPTPDNRHRNACIARCGVSYTAKPPESPPTTPKEPVILEETHIFDKICMELKSINGKLTGLDQLVTLTRHSISQAQDLIDKAIASRFNQIHQIRQRMAGSFTTRAGFVVPPPSTLSTRSSMSLSRSSQAASVFSLSFSPPLPLLPAHSLTKFSISSVFSRIRTKSHPSSTPCDRDASPPHFAAPALLSSEEQHLPALKRLLDEKIVERIDAILDDIDQVDSWLRIIRDVLRHLKRRVSS